MNNDREQNEQHRETEEVLNTNASHAKEDQQEQAQAHPSYLSDVSDPFGLLARSKHFAAAAADAAAECLGDRRKRRRKRVVSEEQLRKERLEANRKSAAESRKRKRELIEELRRTVSSLREENAALKRENSLLQMNCTISTSLNMLKNVDDLNTGASQAAQHQGLGGMSYAGQSSSQMNDFMYGNAGAPTCLQPPMPCNNFGQAVPQNNTSPQELLFQQYQQQLNNLNNAAVIAPDQFNAQTQQQQLLGVSHCFVFIVDY